MRGVCLITFGCKLNQAESEDLKEILKEKGYQVVSENWLKNQKDKKEVGFFIINACSVTTKAEREVIQKINQIKRIWPNSYLVVTGCFISKENKNVNLWIEREKLLKKISQLKPFNKEETIDKETRTRALIKIQDGCDRFCTFCIVPFLRKNLWLKDETSIIEEIKEKEKKGYKEVVLVGANLEKINLVNLLKRILKETNIPRIRISSLWPTAVNNDLINLIKKEPRICPHLHLSIQSGSDRILKKMNRNYKIKDVLKIIKKIKEIPNLNLTADIIVGFPSEKEEDFLKTISLVKKVKFLKVHVFRYSKRPFTPASKFLDQVEEKIKKKRSKILIDLCQKISEQVKRKYLNKKFLVLFENKKDNYWTGLTSNYLRVYTKSKKNLANQILKVKLIKLFKDGLYGKIVL
jgi:threonylcarbamoyladenosine tRNA methylthiotransferase MtaB